MVNLESTERLIVGTDQCSLNLTHSILDFARKTEQVWFLINLLHRIKSSGPGIFSMSIESIKVKFTKLPIALKVFVWEEVTLTDIEVSVKHGLVSEEEHLRVFEQSFWKSHTNLES